jgi:RNA polymerase sigma-70 factor, ECF subfamily
VSRSLFLIKAAKGSSEPLPREAPGGLLERSDAELMQLAQAGQAAAFEVLVGRHASRLVKCCSRITASRDGGAELAQDVWVLVWERRAQFRADADFWVWLLVIARNRFRNELRHLRSVARHEQLELALRVDAAGDQVEALLALERRHRVQAALSEIPTAAREALLLRFAEELCYDEMQVVIGVGESTLRSRVHHGLKKLKELLESKP